MRPSFKDLPLRTRLTIAFMLTTTLTIMAIVFFSLLYFYLSVGRDAVANMRAKASVAELIYDTKADEVENFTTNLVSDKAVGVLVAFDIRNKLAEYLTQILAQEARNQDVYYATIFDEQGVVMTSIGAESSEIVKQGESNVVSVTVGAAKLNMIAADLVQHALQGAVTTGNELVPLKTGKRVLAISCSAPISRDGIVVGGVLVRYAVAENPALLKRMREKLDAEATVFEAGAPVAATSPDRIDPAIYSILDTPLAPGSPGPTTFEVNSIWFGRQLEQFRALYDYNGTPVGVLSIHVPSARYIAPFVSAFIVFLAILLISLAICYFSVFVISRSIVDPIHHLLGGVKRITEGDLSHAILLGLKDEIGTLAEAFDGMRLALSGKITQITEMNANLESTVKERTKTIESLMETMKKYLPSQLYDAMARGQRDSNISVHYRKKLTIFFSDVVSFTPTTESMEAEDLSELLNSYLDAMSRIANKWGGTIDKFIGDAIMIFFGDPVFTNDEDHALRAVRMALEMIEKMKELRAGWLDKGIEKPLHVRVGVNTGYCTIGNFGSADRMDYTIIGGNVNLASRLQSAAEPDTILISHETWSLIKNHIECEHRPDTQLKGISYPVKPYKVIGEKAAAASVGPDGGGDGGTTPGKDGSIP